MRVPAMRLGRCPAAVFAIFLVGCASAARDEGRLDSLPAGWTPIDSPFVAIDTTSVYWTAISGGVWKVPIAGGTPVLLATGPRGAFAIALRGPYVYWMTTGCTDPYWGDWGECDGAILRVPSGGGDATKVVSGQGNAFADTQRGEIASDRFWTTFWSSSSFGSREMMASQVSPSPTSIGPGMRLPPWVAVDASYVYVVSGCNVWRIPLVGGPQVPLSVSTDLTTSCLTP